MGFCSGMARALLIFFNLIFWLSGAAILGVGVWMIVDKNIGNYFTVLELDTHADYFRYASYLLIAFGAFVFLVGFCGCCGAIRGSKCLLGLYIFFLVLIFAGELAAGILMIIYKTELEDKLQTTLKKSIKEEYSTNDEDTKAWDVVQIQLECCGVTGPTDYDGSAFKTSSSKELPLSCCVLKNKDDAFSDPVNAAALNATQCQAKSDAKYYHTKGCEEQLKEWLTKHSAILIGVACGIAGLELFGIVFAICLCREVNKEDKY